MYAARSTIAREPIMAGPFDAMTGQSRQKTPIGESFKISSIHFIKMSLRSLNALTTRIFFSPTRMMENPSRIAITMIWSMFASTIGETKLDGKMFTSVSINEVEAAAS